MSVSAPTATGSPARVPTDIRFPEAFDRPALRRLRAIWKTALRFDPVPAPEVYDAFFADMWSGDPVAERYVDEVVHGPDGPRAARRLLDRALEHGIEGVEDPPPAMVALFEQFETVPDWVDPALVERGAAIWRRWGTDLFRIAGAETLEMYTESAVAVPLSLAGGYAGDSALRRFLETGRFWIDVSEPGALLTIGSAGRATAMRVRVMHVSVRRRVSEHPEWDADRWGLPISQAWMTMTLMGGSITPAGLGWLLGWRTSPAEVRALLHFQRYLGWLLGVHPRRYPESVREGVQLTFLSAMTRSFTAGEHGAELIESFPRAFAPDRDLPPLERARATAEFHLVNGMVALFMLPATRARHDLPPTFPSVLAPIARFPLIALRETVRQLVPGADARLDARARRARAAWHSRFAAGHEAQFSAPSALRR